MNSSHLEEVARVAEEAVADEGEGRGQGARNRAHGFAAKERGVGSEGRGAEPSAGRRGGKVGRQRDALGGGRRRRRGRVEVGLFLFIVIAVVTGFVRGAGLGRASSAAPRRAAASAAEEGPGVGGRGAEDERGRSAAAPPDSAASERGTRDSEAVTAR